MTHNKEPGLSPEDKMTLTEAGKIALQRKEAKEKGEQPPALSLYDWYRHLRVKYEVAIVISEPLDPTERYALKLPEEVVLFRASLQVQANTSPIAFGYGPTREAAEEDAIRKVVSLGL